MHVLLTATGNRPAAWAVCERLMMRQDFAHPIHWVVVDDGHDPQPITALREGWTISVVRRRPFWREGQNTQAQNLLAGLSIVSPTDKIAIIEDDDWYATDWLSVVFAELESAELVGECEARYYNIATRKGRQLLNKTHASLCSTALRGRAIESLKTACARSPKFIDLELWRAHKDRRVFRGHRVVGVKGLPGRAGIGMGHSGHFHGNHDPNGELLKSWIGEDADLYEQVMKSRP